MEMIYGTGTGKNYKQLVKSKTPTIVQIGANDGIVGEGYGLLEWLLQLEDFKLYLIEPIKKHFDKLYDKYGVFGDKVTYLNYAITETEGMFKMSDNEGMSKIDPFGILDVYGITFEKFLADNSISKIDLLLMDCEGYEFKILKGLNLNLMKPKCIRYEYYWIPEKDECDAYLLKNGYQISGCYFDDIYNKIAYLES